MSGEQAQTRPKGMTAEGRRLAAEIAHAREAMLRATPRRLFPGVADPGRAEMAEASNVAHGSFGSLRERMGRELEGMTADQATLAWYLVAENALFALEQYLGVSNG